MLLVLVFTYITTSTHNEGQAKLKVSVVIVVPTGDMKSSAIIFECIYKICIEAHCKNIKK